MVIAIVLGALAFVLLLYARSLAEYLWKTPLSPVSAMRHIYIGGFLDAIILMLIIAAVVMLFV